VSGVPPGAGPPDALYVDERGPIGAPVLVLVHGSMDRSTGMGRVVRQLEQEFRVVNYDRRGYGRSLGVAGPRTIEANVEDLLLVLAERPALVFGHSMGGDIALAAAQRRPDLVRALGVYEAPMYWEPWWPDGTTGGVVLALDTGAVGGAEDAAEAFMRRAIGDERWQRLPPTTRADRRAEGPALVAELTDLTRAAPYDAGLIVVPVLVVRGERSKDYHRQAAALLAQRLASSEQNAFCELVDVPGVTHGVHLQDPEAVAGLVRRLAELAELGAGRADGT
jgi:pimeloyl-ACP methyl ester carboxylesterase